MGNTLILPQMNKMTTGFDGLVHDKTQYHADTEWHSRLMFRDINKARGVKDKAKAKAKAKTKNANVNCRENATVNLSILNHFRYSLEKLQ